MKAKAIFLAAVAMLLLAGCEAPIGGAPSAAGQAAVGAVPPYNSANP